ncbi:hypothetical protein NMY22_g4350 [Coprinellus aureogranulatus]|nr:hypothetical protein NMY22_g4350 [Coprinellus aureogranulatus]
MFPIDLDVGDVVLKDGGDVDLSFVPHHPVCPSSDFVSIVQANAYHAVRTSVESRQDEVELNGGTAIPAVDVAGADADGGKMVRSQRWMDGDGRGAQGVIVRRGVDVVRGSLQRPAVHSSSRRVFKSSSRPIATASRDQRTSPPPAICSSRVIHPSTSTRRERRPPVDSDMPSTPSRPSFLESIRSKNRSSLSIFKSHVSSTSSICSPSRANFDDIHEAGPSPADGNPRALSPTDSTLPRRMSPYASRGQYDNLLDDDEDLDVHYVPPPPLPAHYKRESARSSISFSSPSNTFSRVNLGSLGSKAQRKKKRLVISGVGVHETRKFEGVKQWCEITRVANGDLHIDFRLPEVADTVCRVRAKVFIAGVGSVYLSWTTGDKR